MNRKFYCIISLTLLLWTGWASGASIHVFVPSNVRPNVLKKKLENACPHITFTVFGRGQDFIQFLQLQAPDIILTLPPLLESSVGYQYFRQGYKNGNTTEPYVLVSKDTAIDITKLSQKSIGVVDLMGRELMTEFIHRTLNQNVKVKRVTKIEDLLPLLLFDAVDAIFVSHNIYLSLTEKSHLRLVAVDANSAIGLTTVATNTTAKTNHAILAACINNFDAQLNAMLGVEKWTTN